MEVGYEEIEALKSKLWEMRFISLRGKISKPWNLKDLDTVCKSLKNNQSRDPIGMLNELFKKGVAGNDLRVGVLQLMNEIKSSFFIPEFMEYSDITTIYKNKGSRQDLQNDRGIFVLVVLRNFLDKLTYADKYTHLDNAMSDSNIGARKHKNVRNHLFIVYGVINNVLRGRKGCIDIQIYDLVQAFDALWLEDCLNDLYDYLPENKRDDQLALIYQTNISNLVSVNTAVGQTERVNMPQIVQQGGAWGPMECSVSIDKLGKLCSERGENLYRYKDMVDIMPLAMVDDLLGISTCGLKSLELNTFINTHIEMKRLKFHTPDSNGKTKCHRIHVGKDNEHCPQLKVHGTIMKTVSSDVYLGDVISADGSNRLNIQNRVSKGLGKVVQIMGMLEKVSVGKHYFKIALLFRESIFLSSILSNAEVWYGLSKADTDQLEAIDKNLLRRIFKVPDSTPIAALYLETGSLRIGTILKARRINFLHYLLKLPKLDMLSKFFYAQWEDCTKLDWVEQVKEDLSDFGLPKDLEILESKSEFSMKNLVKKKAKEYELRSLVLLQGSKMENLVYKKLELQEYLELGNMDANLARTVFRFRVRMAQFSQNFPGQGPPKPCPLCGTHWDTQSMAFQCSKVKEKMQIREKYEDIFKPEVSNELAQVLQTIVEMRQPK